MDHGFRSTYLRLVLEVLSGKKKYKALTYSLKFYLEHFLELQSLGSTPPGVFEGGFRKV